jgi:hypothetical protein
VVAYEFSGTVYSVSETQATLLAEALRGLGKGKRPTEEKRVAEQSGNQQWAEGALAVADFTEEILVGNLEGPLPLEGKAAEATFWTLRMLDLDGCGEAADACALRDALGEHFGALHS